MTARIVYATDHAVLRHLERRLGIDVESVRAEIEAVCQRGADGRGDSVLHGQLRYVLRHGDLVTTVTTALPRRPNYRHQQVEPSLSADGGG